VAEVEGMRAGKQFAGKKRVDLYRITIYYKSFLRFGEGIPE
jgi:hypothetical protein